MSNYRYDDDDDDGQSTVVGRDVVFHRFHMCYASFSTLIRESPRKNTKKIKSPAKHPRKHLVAVFYLPCHSAFLSHGSSAGCRSIVFFFTLFIIIISSSLLCFQRVAFFSSLFSSFVSIFSVRFFCHSRESARISSRFRRRRRSVN